MNMHQIRESVSHLGFTATAQDIAYRGANRVTEVTVLKGVVLTMDTVDRKFLADGDGYRWGFLDATALHRGLDDSGAEAEFIAQALAKGDRCYGAIHGDVIASYGWYSTLPTAITAISDDMILHFDSAYAYMYRGYTSTSYRGKRLHGIGMARALTAYVEEGKNGLVSCVELNNFPSLHSSYRLGYRDFGMLFSIKVAGQRHTHATRGCETYAFEMRSEPRAARPTAA